MSIAPKLGAIAGSAAQRLRVATAAGLSAADADPSQDVLHNCVIAQAGPFKSDGRGEFDDKSLAAILALASANPNGLPCSYCHADESHDGLGRHLGRWKDFRLSTVGLRESEGQVKTDSVPCVRADLHFDPMSHKTPEGDLGGYVMGLAKSDPQVISSSLVLKTDREYRINPNGTPMLDAEGNELPPLWRPKQVMGSDIVRTGDAVDGLLSHGLSVDSLPDAILHKGAAMLDKQFAGQSREYVQEHLTAFLAKYLDRRYGPDPKQSGIMCINEMRRLAQGEDSGASAVGGEDEPGSPDAPEMPDANPYAEPGGGATNVLHNGCRSTLAYHHLTACRLCGEKMTACGCDNVDQESRVITMSKEPCAACAKKLEAPGVPAAADAPGKDGDVQPTGGEEGEMDLRAGRLTLLQLD
jgi:hypothetical protein